MPRDYLLQDPAISCAVATGYGPGEGWEARRCHHCGAYLDGYDSCEIEEDFFGNWYCPECWKELNEEGN